MSASETEDEDVKRAIALSLHYAPASSHETVDLTQDSSDASTVSEVSLVGPRSLVKSPLLNAPSQTKTQVAQNAPETIPPSSSASSVANFFGLDRKAMERERLARVALKRQRSVSPPALKRIKLDHRYGISDKPMISFDPQSIVSAESGNVPNKERKASLVATRDTATVPGSHVPSTKPCIHYPYGTVKKTWAYGFERRNDIKIEEVLQKADLKVAVLSSYIWDVPWVLSKFEPKSNLIFVMHAKEESTRAQFLRETEHITKLRLCFPPMPGSTFCMHSKLMLLFHVDYLRVVVPSANLMKFDWGETGTMENSVFMIDLPRLSSQHRPAQRSADDRQGKTDFLFELLDFLKQMGMHEDVRDGVLNFDFSKTTGLGFIQSVGGSHFGLDRSGLGRLASEVRKLGLQTDDSIELDFATSSLGSIKPQFLETLYRCAQGQEPDHIHESFLKPTGKCKAAAVNVAPQQAHWALTNLPFRVYFPTEDTVKHSLAGSANAGTICFQSSYYNNPAFPRSILRDYKSTRPRLLSHNKILLVRRAGDTRSAADRSWAYLGSANCSMSAWGQISKDAASKKKKITSRNWECGVLISPQKLREMKERGGNVDIQDSRAMDLDIFKGAIDIPFEYPGEDYGDRRPWFFQEQGITDD